MSNVIEIDGGVVSRVCPDCGYEMSQLEIDSHRYDFDCPRCKDRKISEYVPWEKYKMRKVDNADI